MVVNYDKELFAVHGVNHFLWSKLQQLPIMKPEYYLSGSSSNKIQWIPIMPTQEAEEFTQSTDLDGTKAPYIVYNWRVENINQNWFIQSDQIAYIIYSDNAAHHRDVSKVIIDYLKRWDESASEINDFLAPRGGKWTQFNYKNTSIVSSIGAEPTDESGGRMQTIITARITYTDEGTFGNGRAIQT